MTTEARVERRTISYFVNGEQQASSEHKLTVAEILSRAGFTPPEDYRLQRDQGHHLYTDYTEEIPLREGERFTAIFSGPTPTS